MVKILLILGTVFFVGSASAQTDAIDSLRQKLAATTEDTTRILLANQLASLLIDTKKDSAIDSALLLVRSNIPLSMNLGFRAGLYELHYSTGRIYGEYIHFSKDSALFHFESALHWAKEMGDDYRTVQALNQIADQLNISNRKVEAIERYEEAHAVAKEMGDRQLQAATLNRMGNEYSYMAKYQLADSVLHLVYKIYKGLNNKKSAGSALANLGNNAARWNKLEKAIGYYNRAAGLFRETENKELEARVYRMVGYSANVLGNYPVSLEYFQKALTMFEDLDNANGITNSLDNLGEVYQVMEDYDQALIYYEKAAAFWEKSGENPRRYQTLLRKGNIYRLKKEYRTALDFYLRGQRSLYEDNGENVSGKDMLSMGECYEKLGQPDSAIFYLNRSIEETSKKNDFQIKAEGLIQLGLLYRKQGQTQKAISMLQQADEAASFSGTKEKEMEAAKVLYQLYKSQKDESQALRYHEIYRNLQDSLFNEKNIKEIARLEANAELEKEKQRLAYEKQQELNQQKAFQRNLFIALGVAVAFILTIGWFYRAKQTANAELSRLNEELRKQKTTVENQKEKLEELDEMKSRFFTNISHEFRTPLTIITGMTNQIKTKPDKWLDKGLRMIEQNSQSLLHLINQILDLRKLESKELKANLVQGDVVKYLQYISESYQSFAESNGLQLHFLSAVEKLQMDYDPDKLLRIVSNLLSNAIKYTPEGGQVYFHISQKEENGQAHLKISVKDTGIGIAKEKLPYIFDRFYQVDGSATRKGEGTGIGLALALELINLLGGRIHANSTPGNGSTFIVLLPVTNSSLVTDKPTARLEEVPVSSTTSPILPQQNQAEELPSLLIVEDNPDVAKYLIACLQDDYQLELADNGQVGIDVALEQVPDLIISDVMMPEKDGFEVCDTLKNDERTSHIPIILLTAKADFDSKISGLKKGADAYLTKPFEPEELQVRLEKLLEIRNRLQAKYTNLAHAQPSDSVSEEGQSMEDAFVEKFVEIITQHISDEHFGIVQLCKSLGMGRTQVHNKIKALTGKSTSLFIRSIRLQKARQLLQTTDMNISEVGYEVGFVSPSHFSRFYAEEFGEPPTKTRG
ncbi:MAG: tetratricopeptide repeat protein [Bacteroidota bacterium]